MGLKSVHPLFNEYLIDWTTMSDLYEGERTIKSKGRTYLPPTSGMVLDGMNNVNDLGYKNYESYKTRAVFPDYVKEAVEIFIGLMHQEEPTIQLPAGMEYLRKKATVQGESLVSLLRRINVNQLVNGRIGLLPDVVAIQNQPVFHVTTYPAQTIRNWHVTEEGLQVLVLDESGYEFNEDFEWKKTEVYRVLRFLPAEEGRAAGYYTKSFNLTNNEEYDELALQPPMVRGKLATRIPFVVVNSKDLVFDPDEAPLLPLGREVLTIYRGEADYRQNLFMQGQDTLVTIGTVLTEGDDGDDSIRTGAGSWIRMDQQGDAKYIGVTSSGLEEQRSALENDRKRAEAKAGQLIAAKGTQAESGEALRTRVSSQTATLNQIAITGAAGLEQALRGIAEWSGYNPDEVRVQPNLEFTDVEVKGQDLLHFMTARTMGAPISKKSIHTLMSKRGLTEMDYETELGEIENEGV